MRCRDQALVSALGEEAKGLVFVADPEVSDRWQDVRAELHEAFALTKQAAIEGEPVV